MGVPAYLQRRWCGRAKGVSAYIQSGWGKKGESAHLDRGWVGRKEYQFIERGEWAQRSVGSLTEVADGIMGQRAKGMSVHLHSGGWGKRCQII